MTRLSDAQLDQDATIRSRVPRRSGAECAQGAVGARTRAPEVLHSERFVDVPPEKTHATPLDEGTYLCSERTMYRMLGAAAFGGCASSALAEAAAVLAT